MNKIKNFLHGISEKMKNKGKKLSDYSWKRYLVSFLILVLLIGVLVVIFRKTNVQVQCRRRLLYGWKWTDALELYL